MEEEGFYDSKAYYSLRNQLCRFVGLEDISQVFTDICVVRSKDHQILASASGFNGQEFESVYMAGTRNLLDTLTAGGQKASMLMGIDGEAYQVLGVSASDGLYPEYLLIAISRREDVSAVQKGGMKGYLVYAELLFLVGSVISISLLLLQGRDKVGFMGNLQTSTFQKDNTLTKICFECNIDLYTCLPMPATDFA